MRSNAHALEQRKPNGYALAEHVEGRVIRQLLEALLFEQIIDYQFNQGRFYFSLGETQYQASGYIAGFSRIRLDQASISQRPLNTEQLDETAYTAPFLDQILHDLPAPPAIKTKLTEQLAQTIKLCQWNTENLPRLSHRLGLDYQDLESQLDEGHPYHPCFKARTGFSIEDHQAYGPECAQPIQLIWLACQRQRMHQSLPGLPANQNASNQPQDREFWQSELSAPCFQQLQDVMAIKGLNWQEHTLLPIHPWQWQSLKDEELAEPLASNELVYLGPAGDLYQASLSVRTLLNISRPDKANIKLPMNMINTSTLRKLNSHSVCSAPVISNWLKTAVKDDPFFQEYPLTLLSEYAGITLPSPSDQASWLNKIPGQLGVIFRESLTPYLTHQQQAIPFSGLYAEEHHGQPLIQPLIEKYGLETWLIQLIDVTVLPVWHLLVKHGLGVEAHGQNMVLIHNNGWPQGLILRDFHDSMEFVEDYLAKPELMPNFDQLNACYQGAPDNEYYWMDSEEALRELIIDTLFVFNFSELACVLERHFQYQEADFWQLIYQRLQRYAQQNHCSQARLDRMLINQTEISTESLIKKKLADVEADHFHHAIQNPFAGFSPLTIS